MEGKSCENLKTVQDRETNEKNLPDVNFENCNDAGSEVTIINPSSSIKRESVRIKRKFQTIPEEVKNELKKINEKEKNNSNPNVLIISENDEYHDSLRDISNLLSNQEVRNSVESHNSRKELLTDSLKEKEKENLQDDTFPKGLLSFPEKYETEQCDVEERYDLGDERRTDVILKNPTLGTPIPVVNSSEEKITSPCIKRCRLSTNNEECYVNEENKSQLENSEFIKTPSNITKGDNSQTKEDNFEIEIGKKSDETADRKIEERYDFGDERRTDVILKKPTIGTPIPGVNSSDEKRTSCIKRCRLSTNNEEYCVNEENESKMENKEFIKTSSNDTKGDNSQTKEDNSEIEIGKKNDESAKKIEDRAEKIISFNCNDGSYLDDIPFPLLCKNVITDNSEPMFDASYEMAIEMNRRRFLTQLRQGALKNCQTIEKRMKELANKPTKQKLREAEEKDRQDRVLAFCFTKISVRILRVLVDDVPNQGIIAKYLLKFLYLPVTPGSIIYVPSFIHVVSFCKGRKDFVKFVRRLANKCYNRCHAMFPIPPGCNFETVYMSEVRKFAPSYVNRCEDVEFDYGDLSETSDSSDYDDIF